MPMRLNLSFLLVAITAIVFGNQLVIADNRGNLTIPLKIPDNFPLGIVSVIRLDDFALLKTINVEVHIAHPHISDLLVQLECPSGQVVTLHNRLGGRKRNLNATYRVRACENSNVVGNWKLRISDNSPSAAGSLLSWKLHAKVEKSDAPIFRIGSIKDCYLIGNAVTPGSDKLNAHIDVSGKAAAMEATIDGVASHPLVKTDAAFDGTLDLTQLPPGLHTLSLTEGSNQTPIARLQFRRSHPLYVLMTTDWDSSDSQDSILKLHEKLHTGHPGLKFTHFLGPYTFTDPSVPKVRQAYLANWLLRLHSAYQDEIGLHIHPFCNFVNTVPGVPCRIKPSDSYDKGDSTGYTVLSAAYSENEYLKLLRAADSLFTEHGLGKPTAFRAGSWAANAGTLKALAEDGFVADSSANNWARIEESRHDGNGFLYTWNREHWHPITDISQPYYPSLINAATSGKPSIPILEIPDNGSLVDYVTGEEMIEIFNRNWFGSTLIRPTTYVMGFHPVSYSLGFHKRIEKVLAHIDNYLAAKGDGPVVYETVSHMPIVFKDLPR
jgi:subtilisin-like proprotein convertase family protein